MHCFFCIPIGMRNSIVISSTFSTWLKHNVAKVVVAETHKVVHGRRD